MYPKKASFGDKALGVVLRNHHGSLLQKYDRWRGRWSTRTFAAHMQFTHLTVPVVLDALQVLGSPLNTHFRLVGGPWCCAVLRYSFCNGRRLVAARCKGESFTSRLKKRKTTLVWRTQLSRCRCCHCTVSLSLFARHFGSKPGVLQVGAW